MRLRMVSFCWCLVTCFRPLLAQDLLIRDVTVLDPSTESQTQGNLLIKAGKIISISSTVPKEFSKKSKLKVVEGKGKWIIPGLIDMHVHATFGNPGVGGVYERLTPEEVSKRALYCGVTGIVDLLADEDIIFNARNSQRKNSKVHSGARIFAAGPMLTAPEGHGTEFGFSNRTLKNPEQAQKELVSLSKKHPDVFKFALDRSQNFKNMDLATLKSGLTKAKELKIPSIVHIATWADAEEAVVAGAEVITHLDAVPIPEQLLKLLKEKQVTEIPTMTYQVDFVNLLENRSILESNLLKKLIGNELYHSYKNMDPSQEQVSKIAGAQANKREGYFLNLKKLREAGIRMMAGTDAGDVGVFQGFSLHREMKLFQDAGFTSWQILKSATATPKKFLNIPLGILPGEVADFVVLNDSPLNDIRNTQELEGVVFNGEWVDREKLLQ